MTAIPNKFYLSTWSVREFLFKGSLALGDFARYAHQFDFQGIEVNDRFLDDPKGESALLQLGEECRALNMGFVLSIGTDFTLEDPKAWQSQIDYACQMIGIAGQVGIKVVRLLLGGRRYSVQRLLPRLRAIPILRSPFVLRSVQRLLGNLPFQLRSGGGVPNSQQLSVQKRQAVNALKQVSYVAQGKGVQLAIENHWGLSTYPEDILEVIERVGSPVLGTCPDFGNFPKDYDPYDGLEKLLPYAFHVHAKSYKFDAKGRETRLDYLRIARLLRDADYRGAISVEYEGKGEPLEGSLKTRQLLQQCLSSPNVNVRA